MCDNIPDLPMIQEDVFKLKSGRLRCEDRNALDTDLYVEELDVDA